MTVPDEPRNRAERRAAKRHKHRWAEKPGYGVVCDVCGEVRR